MMTAKQQQVLDTIQTFVHKHHRQPTLAEIAALLALSESGIHKHVKNLIKLGALNACSGKAAYEIPKQLSSHHSHANPSTIDTSFNYKFHDAPQHETSLPYVGIIAAGKPIEAVADIEHIDLVKRFCGPDRYILRIAGESMLEAGLMNDDYVIVKKQATAERGDVVVALIDRVEATLKYFHPIHSKGLIELRPANSTMEPMVYKAERITIQGVVVGSFRHY